MNSNEWQKVESILDEALFISDLEECVEFIRDTSENEKVEKNVLEWLRAIREAKEVGFMEK